MAKRYILTVLASNRSGILAALTNALDELGGNMLDVSQAVIQDFFTFHGHQHHIIPAAGRGRKRPLQAHR